jgi:hypothetical protein
VSRDKLWPEGYVEDVNAELYVDTLEGEIDEVELEKLRLLRQGLKKSDDVSVPESGAYYDALEARIMASLDAAIEAGDVKDRTVEVAPTVAAAQATLKLPLKKSAPKSNQKPKDKAPQGLVAQAAKLKRRSVSIRAGQLAILAGVALLTTGKWLIGPQMANQMAKLTASSVESSVASHLRATHRAAPEVLTGTVISFESEADLALEIAARRLVAYHKGE